LSLSFFPQIFWGFILFFIPFFIVSYYFLPLLASTLKFKQKYLSTLFKKETLLSSTSGIVSSTTDNNLLLISIKEIDKTFNRVFENCKISTQKARTNILTNTFSKINYQISKIPFLVCAVPTFYRSLFNLKGFKTTQKSKVKKTKKIGKSKTKAKNNKTKQNSSFFSFSTNISLLWKNKKINASTTARRKILLIQKI